MNSSIILGHPFSGSLYMFFDQQLSHHPHKEPIQHPYYRDLFGRDYNNWSGLAFTLLTIFDKVIIPPADAHIPDYHKFETAGIYDNPDLGLYFNWKDSFDDEIRNQVKEDLEDPQISDALIKYSPKEKEGILEYSRLYIKLANKYNCPVLCGGDYQHIFSYLLTKDNTYTVNNENNNVASFTDMYLKFFAPLFGVSSLDSLYQIKNDKEVKLYSKSFRKILQQYGATVESEMRLYTLLKESLLMDSFYNKVSDILNSASLICSAIGLIPGIGVPFSIASLGESLISAKLKNNKYNWYQLIYRIDRVDKDSILKSI